jgi:hypothetical protein
MSEPYVEDAAAAELAALREGVAADVAAEAARTGGQVGDPVRAAQLAEEFFAGALENRVATGGAVTPQTVKEMERFSISQAARVSTGRQSYADVVSRYSTIHGGQPVIVQDGRTLDPAITPRRNALIPTKKKD